MKDVIDNIESKEQAFRDSLKIDPNEVTLNELQEEPDEATLRKLQNVYERRDADLVDEKRKSDYLKAINKITATKSEEELQQEQEVEEFFRDIQEKTDKYLSNSKKEEKRLELKEQEEKIRTQIMQQEKERKRKQKAKTENANTKKEKSAKGSSFADIMASDEFKSMWEESQEER